MLYRSCSRDKHAKCKKQAARTLRTGHFFLGGKAKWNSQEKLLQSQGKSFRHKTYCRGRGAKGGRRLFAAMGDRGA